MTIIRVSVQHTGMIMYDTQKTESGMTGHQPGDERRHRNRGLPRFLLVSALGGVFAAAIGASALAQETGYGNADQHTNSADRSDSGRSVNAEYGILVPDSNSSELNAHYVGRYVSWTDFINRGVRRQNYDGIRLKIPSGADAVEIKSICEARGGRTDSYTAGVRDIEAINGWSGDSGFWYGYGAAYTYQGYSSSTPAPLTVKDAANQRCIAQNKEEENTTTRSYETQAGTHYIYTSTPTPKARPWRTTTTTQLVDPEARYVYVLLVGNAGVDIRFVDYQQESGSPKDQNHAFVERAFVTLWCGGIPKASVGRLILGVGASFHNPDSVRQWSNSMGCS